METITKNPTFEKTVDILVKAYLNDTLMHGDCSACAVGNIVAASGVPKLQSAFIGSSDPVSNAHWSFVFMTNPRGWQYRCPEAYSSSAKEAIDATGYTWEDLAKIEHAFEIAPQGDSGDEWMFNGLMAVVDVLADIHAIDLQQKEAAKLLFVKP